MRLRSGRRRRAEQLRDAGALVLTMDLRRADPVIGIAIGLLIAWSGIRLVRDTTRVLMESTPLHIDLAEVDAVIRQVPGVGDLHDLHVWTVTSGMIAMSCHAIVPRDQDHQRVLRDAVSAMAVVGIHHCTVQIECEPMCENGHP